MVTGISDIEKIQPTLQASANFFQLVRTGTSEQLIPSPQNHGLTAETKMPFIIQLFVILP
jgi:hypothetical protein